MAMRASGDLHIRPLDEQHDRIGFACGVESLDRYLKTQAGQDVRRKANAVFVLVEPDDPASILGYYTLCAIGIAQGGVRSCWPMRCSARSRAPTRSDLRWSWSMRSTRVRPAFTRRTASSDCRT